MKELLKMGDGDRPGLDANKSREIRSGAVFFEQFPEGVDEAKIFRNLQNIEPVVHNFGGSILALLPRFGSPRH